MKPFLPIVCLLCISQNVLGHSIGQDWIHFDDELSYQDLFIVNGSCFPWDSCNQTQKNDRMVPTFEYMCSCNSRCWEIGTCCIDSPYRVKLPIQKCRNVGDPSYNSGHYMAYKCPDDTYSDSVWKHLCEKEWSGEDDILMLSPLTSLETTRTYNNYYCFKCHERTDKYISWNLVLQSVYNISDKESDYSVTYNQAEKTWMAAWGDNPVPILVNVSFEFPYYMEDNPPTSDLRVISNCPDTWIDESVRDKCLAYTAVIYVYQSFTSYKNVHCALCNNVSLDSLTCRKSVGGGLGGGKDIFSFRDLLNINDSTRDKVGDSEKCDNDHLWDPYAKKCRETKCAIPGYVIKDNRCVPP